MTRGRVDLPKRTTCVIIELRLSAMAAVLPDGGTAVSFFCPPVWFSRAHAGAASCRDRLEDAREPGRKRGFFLSGRRPAGCTRKGRHNRAGRAAHAQRERVRGREGKRENALTAQGNGQRTTNGMVRRGRSTGGRQRRASRKAAARRSTAGERRANAERTAGEESRPRSARASAERTQSGSREPRPAAPGALMRAKSKAERPPSPCRLSPRRAERKRTRGEDDPPTGDGRGSRRIGHFYSRKLDLSYTDQPGICGQRMDFPAASGKRFVHGARGE